MNTDNAMQEESVFICVYPWSKYLKSNILPKSN